MWHYVEDGKQAGPVDEGTFDSLVSTGRITPDTHVWREGMPNWVLYRNIAASGAVATAPGTVQCAECGNFFPPEDLVQIGDRSICATCKPIAVQKLKEGVLQPVAGGFHYAGFWMRALAVIVDCLVLLPVGIVLGMFMGAYQISNPHEYNPGAQLAMNGLANLIQLAYSVFFLGRFGATLGMMACGIRVVRPNGDRISYLRAIGRFFANFLSVFSGMIVGAIIGALIGAGIASAAGERLAIVICMVFFMMLGAFLGYLVIVFDKEKRAFHDFLCDTRVVYKR